MNWNGKKVLVTGAGGFIASHLVERLVREGAKVRAFVRYNSRNEVGLLRQLGDDLDDLADLLGLALQFGDHLGRFEIRLRGVADPFDEGFDVRRGRLGQRLHALAAPALDEVEGRRQAQGAGAGDHPHLARLLRP